MAHQNGPVSLAAVPLRQGVLDGQHGRDELRVVVDEDYDSTPYDVRTEITEVFHAFINRMRPGDVVATLSDGELFLGDITGEVTQTDRKSTRLNSSRTSKSARMSASKRTSRRPLSALPA